jgi:hypothetical protein
MPIPASVTADHVREAMSRLQRHGVPPGADSTKYDVVDPRTGARLPPKLVVSIAAEIATGEPFPRTQFSGGEATNGPLRDLGFEIVEKPSESPVHSSPSDIRPGAVITNDELTTAFAVGNAGGMRWSSKHGCLAIIADHNQPARPALEGLPDPECSGLF